MKIAILAPVIAPLLGLAAGCEPDPIASLAWVPGRAALLFAEVGDCMSTVRLVTEGGERVVISSEAPLVGVEPSPDGRRAAVVEAGERPRLRIVDLDSGAERPAVSLLAAEKSPVMGLLSWAPDGRRIAVMAGWTDEASPIWIVDVETGSPATLRLPFTHAIHPRWSPAGDRIALLVRDGERFDLVVVDLATGGLETLERGVSSESVPRWSPDGARIAVASEAGVMVAGRVVVAQAREPAWSPDGGRLAFVGEGGRLGAMDAGGLLEPLSIDGEVARPVWGPAGIAAIAQAPGGLLVRVWDPDTGAVRVWPGTPREALRLALWRGDAGGVETALRACPPDAAGPDLLVVASEILEGAGRFGPAARALGDAIARAHLEPDECIHARAHLALLLVAAGEGDPALEFACAMALVPPEARPAAERFLALLSDAGCDLLRVAAALDADAGLRDLVGPFPRAR